jgi:hypothetical protein
MTETAPRIWSIRTANEKDLNFIRRTWLLGLFYGSEFYSQIRNKIYFDNQKIVVEALIKTSDVLVACLNDDPEVILGYSVTQGPTLHWVHVKSYFRKNGIAKTLIPQEIKQVTFLTKIGKAIKPKTWEFNPYINGEDNE